jgi:hypothetical protein
MKWLYWWMVEAIKKQLAERNNISVLTAQHLNRPSIIDSIVSTGDAQERASGGRKNKQGSSNSDSQQCNGSASIRPSGYIQTIRSSPFFPAFFPPRQTSTTSTGIVNKQKETSFFSVFPQREGN